MAVIRTHLVCHMINFLSFVRINSLRNPVSTFPVELILLRNRVIRSSDDSGTAKAGDDYSELPILHLALNIPFVGFKDVGTNTGLP